MSREFPLVPVPVRSSTRRRFVQGLGLATGATLAPAFLRGPLGEAQERDSALFSLGVASGDPSASSVVLWTRLAPNPLQGGGMARFSVPVGWQIATDPGMTNVIRAGTALAEFHNGHAVKVTARGLPSDSWLWYRFTARGESSRVGRTRTFPAPGNRANVMRFAFCSCQHYESGFWAAYRDLAEQDLDFVIHLGDYIYEGGATDEPIGPGRQHNSPEIFSVQDYRDRYALYRTDENLKRAHAQFPWIVTWDDHEVDNNYAADAPEDDQPTDEFLERRENAYKVYFESMPLRRAQQPDGAALPLFRRLAFGDLADIHVLDTRQFRTDQPCSDGFGSTDPVAAALEPVLGPVACGADFAAVTATLTGSEQEAWLFDGLSKSKATWNVLAQQVMVTEWDLGALGQLLAQTPLQNLFNVDAWDGYPAARSRLIALLEAVRPGNPVVLTGDIHSAWAANLLTDFSDPASDVVGAEFVGTSISSTFGADNDQLVRATIPSNPHIRYFNGLKRGYSYCEVTRGKWVTTFQAVDDEFDADSPLTSDATWMLHAGFNNPGNGGEALVRV